MAGESFLKLWMETKVCDAWKNISLIIFRTLKTLKFSNQEDKYTV